MTIQKSRSKYIIGLSLLFISGICCYLFLPKYLQNYYNENVAERPFPYAWYSKLKTEDTKNFFPEFKNTKSAFINIAHNVNANEILNNKIPFYYINIYDKNITNLIVNDKSLYEKIDYTGDLALEKFVLNNINTSYFDSQSFYLVSNYSYKNWLYSNVDKRKNLINLSKKQLSELIEIFSPYLVSFTDEEKRNIGILYIIAHEMSHTQNYQILTDINSSDREIISDINAILYLIKYYEFDKKKSNEIIDAVENFRFSLKQDKYYAFDELEIIRQLLNSKNIILMNVNNERINEISIKIHNHKIIIDKKIVKSFLKENSLKIITSKEDIKLKLLEYKSSLKKKKKLNKSEDYVVNDLVETYGTTAFRKDLMDYVNENMNYELKRRLNINNWAKNNSFLFIILQNFSQLDKIDYLKEIKKMDEVELDGLATKIQNGINEGFEISLSDYVRLISSVNLDYADNYVKHLKNNVPAQKDLKLILK